MLYIGMRLYIGMFQNLRRSKIVGPTVLRVVLIHIFQQDRILPVQLFCTSIRTETKQNTCVSLSYMPMYLYNDFVKTASESEKGACDSVVLHG